MKVQILSDLHNEFLRSKQREANHVWHGEIPNADADIIILAGDIDTGTKGAEWALKESHRLNKPILYVLGNHEFYKQEYFSTKEKIKKLCEGTSVKLLDCDIYESNNVRFIGATLWTDYKLNVNSPRSAVMQTIESSLADHSLIRIKKRDSYSRFTPSDAYAAHIDEITWLEKQLSTDYQGKTVVITHHGPHRACQHPDFPVGELSAAFYSDLKKTISSHNIDLWIHGHTHANLDCVIHDTRILSNQAGYPNENIVAFNPKLAIEL